MAFDAHSDRPAATPAAAPAAPACMCVPLSQRGRPRRHATACPACVAALGMLLAASWVSACDGCEQGRSTDDAAAPSGSGAGDSGATHPTAVATPTDGPADASAPSPRCPPEMVLVAGRLCVDRYEAVLVDLHSGERASPYYSPSSKLAVYAAKTWEEKRKTLGGPKARAMPLPKLPLWQRERDVEPKALSRKGMTPNGHVSGKQAEVACRNAGKRLCTLEEWRLACRGEQDRQFPYGDRYVQGKCNVFREAHPAGELHDDVTMGHSDPRLNLVEARGKPLLRKTGETEACRSEWNGDAIYDMVGNLDEWVVGTKDGTFAGGFYARATREGCSWSTSAHPSVYADYSTGVRCCADLPSTSSGSSPGEPDELEVLSP